MQHRGGVSSSSSSAESRIMHEEQILEAIDQLRRRKARPDADRICNYLLRKCSVDARDTIADLHRLIEAEKVIQVDYKGNTSYRNASKWSRLQLYKNKPEGFVKEKLNSSMVAGAVAELVISEPDYLDQGVPPERLIEQLINGSTNPTTRRVVDDFLIKEVSTGNLTILNNGNYSLVSTNDDITLTAQELETTKNNHHNNKKQLIQNSYKDNNSNSAATPVYNNSNSSVIISNNNKKKNKNNITSNNCSNNALLSMVNNTYADNFNELSNNAGESNDHHNNKDIIINNKMTVKLMNVNNTPRSSARQSNNNTTSPAAVNNNKDKDKDKDNGYEIIIVDNNKQQQNLQQNSKSARSRFVNEINKELDNNSAGSAVNSHNSNLKRGTKSERKQRLEVRNEEPALEIEFKYTNDHYHNKRRDSKDSKDAERDRESQRREDNAQLSEERDEDEAGRSSTNPSPTPSSNNAGSFRSARRKRAKKVFDPSDNNVVRSRKRGRQTTTQTKAAAASAASASSSAAAVVPQESPEVIKPTTKEIPQWHCSLCAKQKQERLVACRDCTVRAHPSCIYSPEELIHKLGSSWQCERCKSCTVCCETSDAGALITCYSCDEAYHSSCHTPRIPTQKSSSKWHCSNCTQKHCKPTNIPQSFNPASSRPTTPSHPSTLPPVLSPQVSPARGSSDQMDDDGPRDGIDPNIPDASDWTSEQVYQYFARLFPKEAEVFRQQDIDGHSLLLMKRSDVLTSMDLLLGPALKIYRHVLKLQVRRDDPRLYWL